MLKLTLDNKDKLDDIIITEDTILNIRLDNCSQDINIDVMDNMCLEVFEIGNNTSNKINYNLRSNAIVIVNKLARNNFSFKLVYNLEDSFFFTSKHGFFFINYGWV